MELSQRVPVVAVVASQGASDTLGATLDALRRQTYDALSILVLVDDESQATLAQPLVDGIVHVVHGSLQTKMNAAANLVAGDNGLFWFLVEGDEPTGDALEMLVRELLGSNAGVAGPKLVNAADPTMMVGVGLTVDRFGEFGQPIGSAERDQEQHDAIRDVVAVDLCGALVRADLFRNLSGLQTSCDARTAAVEFCWKVHLSGGRVLVVPSAVVRQQPPPGDGLGRVERTDLTARVDMVLVTSMPSQLAVRVVELFVLSLAELVIGTLTGRPREAWYRLIALLTCPLRVGNLRRRRREIAAIRRVDDREVRALMGRGSTRASAFLRRHETSTVVTEVAVEQRARSRSYGPALAWFIVVLSAIVGSRGMLSGRVPAVGRWLPLSEGEPSIWSQLLASWDGRGIGASTSLPTGVVLMRAVRALPVIGGAISSWGLGIGAYVLGLLGMQRLLAVYPTSRARVAAFVVYAAGPSLPVVLGAGNIDALVMYVVLPWAVHFARRLGGLGTADLSTVEGDLVDGHLPTTAGGRRRAWASIVLVVACGGAISPVVVPLTTVSLGVLAIASIVVRAKRITTMQFANGAVAAATSLVLLAPWSLTWNRITFSGGQLAGAEHRSVLSLINFGGSGLAGALGVALIVPVVAALLITRAWRLSWAARGAFLVLAAVACIALRERGYATGILPNEVICAGIALFGASLCVASIAGGFGADVARRSFGWRQPLALFANVAVAVAVVPAVIGLSSGTWGAPEYPLSTVITSQFPAQSSEGPYRVLWVGDPRTLPVPGESLQPGVSFAIVDAGPLTFEDTYATPHGGADDVVRSALTRIATGETSRAGRLLAPLGVKFIAVPVADGVVSTLSDPVDLPSGLLQSFGRQLDIGHVQSPPSIEVFLNRAWVPPAAFLTGAAADASRRAGEESLLLADLSEVAAVLVDGATRELADAAAEVGPQAVTVPSEGVLHLAVPYDHSWHVELDGIVIEPRPSFGVATAFDIPRGGSLVLSRDRSFGMTALHLFIAVLWVVTLLAATRPDRQSRDDETFEPPLIVFDGTSPIPVAQWRPSESGDS